MRFSSSIFLSWLVVWETSSSLAFQPAFAAAKKSTDFRTTTATTTRLYSSTADEAVPTFQAKTNSAFARYKQDHERSLQQPDVFWGKHARNFLDWDKPFDSVLQGSLKEANIRWFEGGKLNVAYNAIDRHVEAGKGNHLAMIWEGTCTNI